MSTQNEAITKKWVMVRVPAELHARLKELSTRYGKTLWKIMHDALAFYEAQLRRPRTKEELPMVDKVSWYIVKVAMSVGALKENPTKENLERLARTLAQVQERLGINPGLVFRAAMDYVRDKSDEAKMELNMALKSLVLDMIYFKLFKEYEEAFKAPQAEEQSLENP